MLQHEESFVTVSRLQTLVRQRSHWKSGEKIIARTKTIMCYKFNTSGWKLLRRNSTVRSCLCQLVTNFALFVYMHTQSVYNI